MRDTYKLVPIISLGIVSVQVVGGKHQVVVEVPSDMPPSTTLRDEELRRRWVEEATKIASEFKPEYLQLGNDVNFIYEVDPDAFDDYMSLYRKAYDAVKRTSPNTKVFPVFSYNLIVRNSRWELFDKLEEKYDFFGIDKLPMDSIRQTRPDP